MTFDKTIVIIDRIEKQMIEFIKNLFKKRKQLNISDVMFSEERTEVKCCIGGYIIEKDRFGATGRILRCKKHLT